MNILADIPHSLVAIVIFLIARTIAGLAATLARPAGFILTFAAGMMLSSFQGMTAVQDPPLARASFDLAAGLLLFSSAFLTLGTPMAKAGSAWPPAGLPREFAVQALPAAGLLVPLIGNSLFPGTFTPGTLRLGMVLALAFWLVRQGRPLDLVLALIAWLMLDTGFLLADGTTPTPTLNANTLPYLLLLGSGSLIFVINRIRIPKKGSPGWNLSRDGLIVFSVAFAISLRLLGASWGLAALGSGIVAGLAGRSKDQRNNTASMQIMAFESGLACSFAVGLGMGLAGSSVHPAEVALIALSALAIPALRGLLSSGAGKRRERLASLLPTSALPLAMVLTIGMDSLPMKSMAFGLVVASLATLPSAKFTLTGAIRPRHSNARWKPLVAVSRRGNAAGILAFAYSLADPDQPIRSVCVAATPGSQGPDAAEAEETLVRAVAAGASSGYRILPSMITAASTADGLARAALERRSDCILAGWNENPTPSDPKSRSVVDALVRVSPATVISVKKPEIFNRAKRLVFVTMAGSMPESGYRQAAAIAVAAWGRNPSGMETLVIGGSADELAGALGLDQGQIITIPVWRDIPETVRRGGSQVPAFFVAAARPDWPGWNPGTERIPLVIEDAFPDAALAVFYLKTPTASGESPDDETGSGTMQDPGESRGEGSGPARGEGLGDRKTATEHKTSKDAIIWPPLIQAAIQSGRIMTAMKEAVLVDALSTLTKALFPGDRTAASRMASDFSTVARTEPIELAPGILLLHAHSQGIAVPALAIGVNRDGWRLVALDEAVRIIIMLVSPAEAGPAAHLEALTQIAKAIRDHGFAQAILDPEREEEFSPGQTQRVRPQEQG
jgi:hypothetical protein